MKAFGSILCAVAFLAGGCQSVQQRQQSEDEATCARLGAVKGTERDFQCRLTLETQRRNGSSVSDALAQQRVQDLGQRMILGR